MCVCVCACVSVCAVGFLTHGKFVCDKKNERRESDCQHLANIEDIKRFVGS